MQRYLFKLGTADQSLLTGIVEFVEEGVAAGTGVLELVGDELVNGSRTRRDPWSVRRHDTTG